MATALADSTLRSPIRAAADGWRASVSCRTGGRQFADRAAGMRRGGGRLLPWRGAYNILVRNRFVIALLLTLEIEIANAERAGAIIDAEHAAFLLVARCDQPVVAGVLLGRAVAAAIAGGDAERARTDIGSPRIVSELARDHVARQFVEAVDER